MKPVKMQVFKRYSEALQEMFKECAPKYLPKEVRAFSELPFSEEVAERGLQIQLRS